MQKTKILGVRIAEARKRKGLTLKEVAADIGVAASTIQRYEKGAFEKIKLPIIKAIAECLNVNSTWLVGVTDERKERPK